MKLQRVRFFPILKKTPTRYKHTALIGLGGNEGNVKRRFVKLYRRWIDDPRWMVRESSPIFKNPPFGYTEQNDFYNALMVMETSLHVRVLLKTLLHVEKQFRRVRVFKNGPRTLDLDIIFFDDQRRMQKDLIVPHPHWHERQSVIVPLLMLKCFKG